MPKDINASHAGHNSAVRLNAWYAEIKASDTTAKERAADIGAELIEIKADVEHGAFKTWIEENCDFSYNSAKDYMKVAELKKTARCLFDEATSIRNALAKAKPPKPEADTKPKAKTKKVAETALDRKISGLLATKGELTRDQIRDEVKADAGKNPTNSVNQALARLAQRSEVTVEDGVYRDPSHGTTVDDLNKTNRQKYEVLERRLTKSFEYEVEKRAREQLSVWKENAVNRALEKLDDVARDLKRVLKLQNSGGLGLDPDGYAAMKKVLKAASRGASISEDLGRKAEEAFDAMGLRPFNEDELARIERDRKFVEDLKKAGLWRGK